MTALVFLPGLGAPGYLRPWVEGSRAWAEVEVLDLPGWRRGRADRCAPTIGGIAEAARTAIAHRPDRSIVLVGHSTAAQSAALVARAAPASLLGVVLASPTFDPAMAGWFGLCWRVLRTLPHERLGEVPAVLPRYLQGGGLPVLRLLRDGMRSGAGVYLPAPVPVHVLTGRHDRLAPPRWAARLAALLGASAGVVPGGHNFCFTRPVEADRDVRTAVERWVGDR